MLAQWNMSFWEWDLNLQSPFPVALLGHHATITSTGNKPKRRSATMLGDRRSQGEDQGERESGAAGFPNILVNLPNNSRCNARDKEAPIEQAYKPFSSPPGQITMLHLASQIHHPTSKEGLPTWFLNSQFFGCPTSSSTLEVLDVKSSELKGILKVCKLFRQSYSQGQEGKKLKPK